MRRHCYIFLIPRRRVKNFFTKKRPQAEPMQSETLGDQKQVSLPNKNAAINIH